MCQATTLTLAAMKAESGRKGPGDESELFGHQWLQKTMDFLSELLSARESGTDETNSTEIDNLQPDNFCLDENTLSNCSSESVTPDQQLQDEELEEPDSDYTLTASMDTPASSADVDRRQRSLSSRIDGQKRRKMRLGGGKNARGRSDRCFQRHHRQDTDEEVACPETQTAKI